MMEKDGAVDHREQTDEQIRDAYRGQFHRLILGLARSKSNLIGRPQRTSAATRTSWIAGPGCSPAAITWR
jgi:hypothetical protein